ncbi:MAG: hypothetical protein CMJ85_10380 [Planctomycetes bacterium]|nr:hypothetical protein [Planctomycetota bacterium]
MAGRRNGSLRSSVEQPLPKASELPDPPDCEPIRPRRVLFFGKKKSRSCCTGALVQSLRNQGLKVKWVNCSLLKRWIGAWGMRYVVRYLRKRYRPDLCFVFFHDLPHVLMQEFTEELPTVVWIEEPIKYIDSAQVDYVRQARLVCLSTPSLVWAYRSLGVQNATFQMSGFSPQYHKPHRDFGQGHYDRDLVYIGGPGSMGNRPEFLAWLSERYDLEIFGTRDSWLPYMKRYKQLRVRGEVRPSRYAEVCARSKIVIGLNQTHESSLYYSNRVFLTLACKGFHLMRHVPGTERVFDRDEHLAWFHDRDECLEQVDRYLGDQAERERIAEQGHALVMKSHRYDRRVTEILEIIAQERQLSCPLDLVDEVLEIGIDEQNETAAVLYPRDGRVDFEPARRCLRHASGFGGG